MRLAPCVPHELHLAQLAREYRAVVHPPSRPVAFEQELGVFGNGNHCDYFVGELRSTALPIEAVQRAYADVPVEVQRPEQLRGFTDTPPLLRLSEKLRSSC